jgi:hypothetical protein
MTFRQWWSEKSRKAKVVTLLTTLLIVETGLCFTTPFTVAPAYETFFGPTHDSELALGLEIWQFFLWLITLVALLLASVWTSKVKSDDNDEEK